MPSSLVSNGFPNRLTKMLIWSKWIIYVIGSRCLLMSEFSRYTLNPTQTQADQVSFASLMEMSFAAYAAIMCILMVDIAQQDTGVQLQIMQRSTQLKYS